MPKLGQLLVQRGWAAPQDVQAALRSQRAAGGRLGTCLLESNALSEDLLLKALSEQHRLPAVGVEDLRDIPAEAISVLPAKLAIRCNAVPFRAFGTQVHVAMLDPRDLNCQDEIAFAAGKRVQPFVASEVRLKQALERYYGEECPSRLATLAERLDRARYLWREQEQPAAANAGSGDVSTRRLWENPEAALFGDEPTRPGVPGRPGPRRVPPPPRPAPAAPAPPAARSQRPPAPTSVTLTDEERAAIEARRAPPAAKRSAPTASREDESTRPVPPDAPPLPFSFEEAAARLERAQEPEEVARLLVAFLGRRFERVALFQVLRERVAGWLGAGASLDLACLQGFTAGFSEPSVFLNLRQGGSFFLGPLPAMPVHKTLARCWGGSLPRESLVVPVRIRGRLVTAIYLDRGPGRLGKLDLEPLLALARSAGDAYERCIFRKKKD